MSLGVRVKRSTPKPHFSPFASAFDESLIPTHQPYISPKKIGRNDPCPCGSGKKYKKCCLQKKT